MKRKESIKKAFRFGAMLVAVVTLVVTVPQEALADMPYDTYSYNYWGEEVKEPHSYLYTKTITYTGEEKLKEPSDLFLRGEKLYVADTGNSRIVILDLEGNQLQEIFTGRSEEDPLNGPQGIFVTEDNHIYVADTGNSRLVEYDHAGNFLREIGRPDTTLLAEDQAYSPTKVVVDDTGRIYVIAYGLNLGLVEFDSEGNFQGFMGATQVSVSPFTYIWKNYFSTQAQQDRMETIVPTEYSNIFVDHEDFIYATINNLSTEDRLSGADALRRLNLTGKDILRRLGNTDIIGDLESTTYGWDFSSFVDVFATEYGCYFVLDETDGKIFAYDPDGVSLFAFGSNGIREGNFQKPVSLVLNDDESRIYVLDKQLNSIFVFDITEYGRHLLNAIRLNSLGDADGATAEWQEVLRYNSNSELAYIGLGKTHLTEGDYEKAMEYFKLGNSRKYYSKAFYYYRKEVMEEYLTPALLTTGGILLGAWLIKKVIRLRRWVGEVRCFMEKQ